MSRQRWFLGLLGVAVTALATGLVVSACTSDASPAPSPRAGEGTGPVQRPPRPMASAPRPTVDDSHSMVRRITSLKTSPATRSVPLRDIAPASPPPRTEHDVHYPDFDPLKARPDVEDLALQTRIFPQALSTTMNFLGQGDQASYKTITGDPPDTNGTVGPNHYMQVVNGGLAIYNKATGAFVWGSSKTSVVWTNYGTSDGNTCATRDDGDAVVLYDALADRWFITQFDVPNDKSGYPAAKSWQCIAVSETSDPTGSYFLYDFEYPYVVNDYGKFGVWPDGYYATYDMFGSVAHVAPAFVGTGFCAFQRSQMLQGLTATEQCSQDTSGAYYAFLPATFDGQVDPPSGEPGIFVGPADDGSHLYLFKYAVDWTTPGNTTLTGPTSLTVTSYNDACSSASNTDCIPQNGTSQAVDSLAYHLMFRLPYRNYGTYESLLANESVQLGSSSTYTGVRWYELRSSPLGSGSWSVYQQGTFAPDTNHRWMASIAGDQAGDIGLGYSISGSSIYPEVGVTGHAPGDGNGTMGQGETVVYTGNLAETTYFRWGDYSSMSIDPSDDCTFWYTTEYYATDPDGGTHNADPFDWQSRVASFTFPSCAQNDFSISVTDPSAGESVVKGGSSVSYTIKTASTKGSAETITLNIEDLPTGVTASFGSSTLSAGSSTTLTLTASSSASLGDVSFIVIGTATSACHPASGHAIVVSSNPASCTPGNEGVWCWDVSALGSFTYGPLGMNSEGVADEVGMAGGHIGEFAFSSGSNKFSVGDLSTTATRAVPAEFSTRNGASNVTSALFFGTTDGYLYRVDASTGACVWRASIARGSGGAKQTLGDASSGGTNDYLTDYGCTNPSIENSCSDGIYLDPIGTFTGDDHTSYIIVGTRNGATCTSPTTTGNRVYAFRADDGTFEWEYDPEPTTKLGSITSLYPDVYSDTCTGSNRNHIVVGSLAPSGGGAGALVTISPTTGAQVAVDNSTGYITSVASQSSLAFNDGARCGHFYSAGSSSIYVGTLNATASCTTPPCELTTFGSGSHSYGNVSLSRSNQGQLVVRQDSSILLLYDNGTTLTEYCSYTPPSANGNVVGNPGSLGNDFYFATSKGSVIELPFYTSAGTQTNSGGACTGAKIRQFSASTSTQVADPGFDFDSTFTQAYLFVGDQAGRIEGFKIPLVSAN